MRILKLIAALTITLGLVACGEPKPVTTTLSALSAARKDFNGRLVIVSGTLRTFDDPKHYWIENESLDRVGVKAEIDLAPWVGKTIEVQGKFVYDPDAGQRIKVQEITLQP